ncbi:MAG: TetR/AcrR family transcriptional regulator [Acidimicrobiia bacterium]|jgi:AcrR family transcriptional regulator
MAEPVTALGADEGEVPADGRRARRHRSRDLAVDALLDLIDEGVLRPTAQQVADRSGVSLRSIFRIFEDVQSLHEAATARHLSRVGHLFVPIGACGDLAERADTTARSLGRLYGAVGPIRRAALRLAPESDVFAERLHQARRWLRTELDRIFQPELEARGRPNLRAALEALCSFEAWDQLRWGQGLDEAEAVDVVREVIVDLLG